LFLVAFFVPQLDCGIIAIVLGFITYYSDLYGYYKLKSIFGSVKRDFLSPFGIGGAVFASIIFTLGLIGCTHCILSCLSLVGLLS
jgi:hypothetical protein